MSRTSKAVRSGMAMLMASACACSVWLSVQVSAFVNVPGVSISHQRRPAAKRQDLLRLHGGGLHGTLAEGASTDAAASTTSSATSNGEHPDEVDDNSGHQGGRCTFLLHVMKGLCFASRILAHASKTNEANFTIPKINHNLTPEGDSHTYCHVFFVFACSAKLPFLPAYYMLCPVSLCLPFLVR